MQCLQLLTSFHSTHCIKASWFFLEKVWEVFARWEWKLILAEVLLPEMSFCQPDHMPGLLVMVDDCGIFVPDVHIDFHIVDYWHSFSNLFDTRNHFVFDICIITPNRPFNLARIWEHIKCWPAIKSADWKDDVFFGFHWPRFDTVKRR